LLQELVTVREENLSLTKELDQVMRLTGKNESELAEQLQQQINKQEQVVQQQQKTLMAAEVKIKQLYLRSWYNSRVQLSWRAVTEETRKWEARERWLVQQVDELKSGVIGHQVSRQMLLNNNSCAVTSNCINHCTIC